VAAGSRWRLIMVDTSLPGERWRPAAVTAGVVSATIQRAADQQRQQQADDAGQHHDDARNMHIQAAGERCGDSKPQDRPGRDQNDADDSDNHPPTVCQLDQAGPFTGALSGGRP
jgi:hypothetical protein